MVNKLVFGVLLAVGLALVVAPFANNANATPQQGRTVSATGFSYAQLTVSDDGQSTWDEGGNQIPQTRTLRALQRQLGNNQRTGLVNLLNAIGAQGWELVSNDIDGSQAVWNFKRRIAVR
jgi:hypothetical protein